MYVFTCLTQLYLMVEICTEIYCINNNYMFRHFMLVIFRLRRKRNLLNSYTRLMWTVYSGELWDELSTRSRMCYVVWAVWVHGGSAIICYVYVNIVRSTVPSCLFMNTSGMTNLMIIDIISTNIRWYRRSNYINIDTSYNSRTPMYPHRPYYITHARSRAHLPPYLPPVYSPHK